MASRKPSMQRYFSQDNDVMNHKRIVTQNKVSNCVVIFYCTGCAISLYSVSKDIFSFINFGFSMKLFDVSTVTREKNYWPKSEYSCCHNVMNINFTMPLSFLRLSATPPSSSSTSAFWMLRRNRRLSRTLTLQTLRLGPRTTSSGRARNEPSRSFHNPTRAFSWLKAPTSTSTIKDTMLNWR